MTYVNPVAAFARVLNHENPELTDDIATVLADQKGLQAVTAAMIMEPEFSVYDYFYMFNEEGHECGMGSWTLCDGVDPHTDGSAVDIWTASGRCMSGKSPETRIFVRKTDLVPIMIERSKQRYAMKHNL